MKEDETKDDTLKALVLLTGCASALTSLSMAIIHSLSDAQRKVVLSQVNDFVENL